MKAGDKKFLDLAKRRKTTFLFKDKSVSDKDIELILEAGRYAPSSFNIQPWRFIVIKNKKTISDLINSCHYGMFHTDPNTIIAIVFNENRASDKYRAVKHWKVGKIDGLIAIGCCVMSMSLESTSLGIDNAILTPDEKIVYKHLKLPKNEKVYVMLGLGYEKKEKFVRKKERLELKDITCYEYHGNQKK